VGPGAGRNRGSHVPHIAGTPATAPPGTHTSRPGSGPAKNPISAYIRVHQPSANIGSRTSCSAVSTRPARRAWMPSLYAAGIFGSRARARGSWTRGLRGQVPVGDGDTGDGAVAGGQLAQHVGDAALGGVDTGAHGGVMAAPQRADAGERSGGRGGADDGRGGPRHGGEGSHEGNPCLVGSYTGIVVVPGTRPAASRRPARARRLAVRSFPPLVAGEEVFQGLHHHAGVGLGTVGALVGNAVFRCEGRQPVVGVLVVARHEVRGQPLGVDPRALRSEERRVGKEWRLRVADDRWREKKSSGVESEK